MAAWAKHLAPHNWDRILASDIKRALNTAEIINQVLQVPLTVDGGLREQDWGSWTGRLFADIEKPASAQIEGAPSGWHFRPPGGEDRKAVLTRGIKVLESAAKCWSGQRILVVTHEGMIRCLTYFLLGRKYLPVEPKILKPYRLHWLSQKDGRLHIDQLNGIALNPS